MFQDPRKTLRQHKLKPKYEWGQNFLISQDKVERIVSLLGAQPQDRVLELGAGTGVLTHMLTTEAPQTEIFALERDRDLVALLEAEFAHSDANVQVIAADAATFNLNELPEGGPLRVLGNLPYNISSPILFHLLEQRHLWKRSVLMLQKEVAERLAATPDSGKAYSILSVRFGMFFDILKVLSVSRRCFHPQPQVDSVVIRLDSLPEPRYPLKDEALFARTVKAVFASRRKTLLNTLNAGFSEIPREAVESILQTLNIDVQRRGESLSLEEFAHLSNTLYDHLQTNAAP
ncbi:MAG: ribosomal RNA small subunit methyltransferase A [Myxococcales bacterium]|nr:ribosomal RNA small subunit methyltransferase A [Myxococcales bacterium]